MTRSASMDLKRKATLRSNAFVFYQTAKFNLKQPWTSGGERGVIYIATIGYGVGILGWILGDFIGVEAKAMLEGLKLAWERGFRQVEVETDNALLLEILHFVKLRLLSRDGNRVADCLAKEILNQLIILDELSIYVRRLLKIDVYHVTSDVIDGN
ncbi:hypothetical protein Golob_022241 [Gossypium lobatum]|uniref:RNase H type-1 domain-containing protein n=1 Tax=Gossypium lobatum TaxID=34289 RepID=A0A7J8LG14_9ROSI|nr:hypothetical protein [Gossypium lobatum]